MRFTNLKLCLLCVIACCGATLRAVEGPPEEDPTQKKRGPIFSGTIRWRGPEDVIAYKGIVITLGQKQNAFLCYDTELMRVSLGWTAEDRQFGLVVPRINAPPPRVKGTPIFQTAATPGWAHDGSLADPRPDKRGPLPRNWAHHKGLFLQGRRVILNYSVGQADVLESPDYFEPEGRPVFTRAFQTDRDAADLELAVLRVAEGEMTAVDQGVTVRNPKSGHVHLVTCEGVDHPNWRLIDGALTLKIARVNANQPFRLAIASLGKPEGQPRHQPFPLPALPSDLRQATHGGPALWPQTVTTRGRRATDGMAYVVDQLTEPVKNPWNADTLFGGIDFFPDGRAALCTAQGEVWIVSGIDASLEKLTWRRFASGLFQPLGLRIVKGDICVVGRDQITRLRDLNGDGEADQYVNINNDPQLSSNPADYSLDIQTDSAGNFYYGKATPWMPEIDTPHQGVIFKISPDGEKSQIIATGLRVPNGLTIGPNDEIAVSDQQGHWQPSSKLNIIRPGAFYGMMPSAQRPIEMNWGDKTITVNPSDPAVRKQMGFTGYGPKNPIPTARFEPPLAWLPYSVDNSSGAPFWALTDRWGPLGDQLLFTSYGRCALFATLRHKVGDREQAAMLPFNLPFDTGIMRGRVNPQDGQVYVAGLKGWLTIAQKPSGLYRVRYTGKPAHVPVDFKVTRQGVVVRFSDPLHPGVVSDLSALSAERWNYHYSGNYGSLEYSVTRPKVSERDKLPAQAARLSEDARRLTIDFADMRPCQQFQLNLDLRTADGSKIYRTLYITLPVLEE